MASFRLVHDMIGINVRKVSSSVKESVKSMNNKRKKLRNCERVKKMKC